MREGADGVTQFRSQTVARWIEQNPLAVLAQRLHEGDRPTRIVSGDVIGDGFEILFGQWRQAQTHQRP
ncbi:MAG TPA: hypothetical protein PLC66_16125 [Thauera sp.]|nr:hypothetical protein [Thauera sp.]